MTSTSNQPISGSRARSASPPAASEISWAPRQTAEQRHPGGEQLAEQLRLGSEPGVPLVLVGVHRAAEGHHRVVGERVGGRIGGLGDVPDVELGRGRDRLGEHAGAGIALMGDREHPHAREHGKPARDRSAEPRAPRHP